LADTHKSYNSKLSPSIFLGPNVFLRGFAPPVSMTDQNQSLAKSFEPATIEQKWSAAWEAMGVSRATLEAGKPDFCIQLPPPNVTGTRPNAEKRLKSN